MDDLSCALNRFNIGGRIGGEILNHLSGRKVIYLNSNLFTISK